MLIPLYWLLLILASMTGVQPPPDVPRDINVLVQPMPAQQGGWYCGAVGILDTTCPAYKIKAGDITLNTLLWWSPWYMQHIATHELGHHVCAASKGDFSEECAEAYACKWVPLDITVSGVKCEVR